MTELFTTWVGLLIIFAYPAKDVRVDFLARSVSNIIFLPTRTTSIKISCDNGTYRKFIIYIVKNFETHCNFDLGNGKYKLKKNFSSLELISFTK